MHKIVYFENVLEFKKNTQAKLQRAEINDWMLCRTCLCNVDADSPDLLKLCIMGTDGGLLNARKMLMVAAGLQVRAEDKLPLKICKDCLHKLSTFYFFKLQIERSEIVLKRLHAKLNEAECVVLISDAAAETENNTHSELPTGKVVDNDEDCSNSSTVDEAKEMVDSAVELDFMDLTERRMCLKTEEAETEAPEQEQTSANGEESEQEPEQEPLEEHVLEEIIGSDDQDLMEEESIGYIVRKVDEDLEMEVSFEEEAEEADTDNKVNENAVKTEVAMENMEEEYYLENEDETSNNSISTNDGEVLLLNLEDVVNVEILDDNENSTEEKKSAHKIDLIKDQEEADESYDDNDLTANEPKKKKSKVIIPLLENLNCNLCDLVFKKQCLLVAHVQEAHPNTKAFKCRVCGKMFTHLQSLSRHMVTHKTIQYRNICDLCGKAFLRTDDWKRHIRVHTGERPYICPTCGKAFKQTNELKEHQLTHIKGKLFECNVCGHRMSSRNGLYIHRRAHTGIKNYICTHCEKRFLTNGELKSHMNVHLKKAQLEEE